MASTGFTDLSQTAPSRTKPAQKLPRLAPLDHVRNLYADTTATLPPDRNRRIFQKKDLVQALRTMSPMKTTKTTPTGPSAGHVPSINSGPADGAADPSSKALVELEHTVNSNVRRFNELKMQTEKKQEQVKVLQDTLHELQVENEALAKITAKQTAESQRIEILKGEIGKVEQAMEDKEFRKRQLAHMTERLRKNQIVFDAHIKSMEDALNASEKELTDVTMYLRQLETTKEEALIDLRRYQAKLAAEGQAREKELDEKRAEVEAARKIEEWKAQRETIRQEMAAEMRGEMSAEQEAKLVEMLQEKEASNEQLKLASKERADRAATLEDAFLAIKQATGVSTLDEMVEKFLNQGASRAALEDEQAEAEARLAKVKAAKDTALQAFTEMKASGLGGTELNREIYNKMEDEISEAKATLKVSKASCERLEGVLVAVRQGAVGLSQKLQPFNSLLREHADDEEEEEIDTMEAVESMDTLSVLLACEKKLGVMLEILGRGAGDGKDPVIPEPAAPVIHKNNVRVLSKTTPLEGTSTFGRRARVVESSSESESDGDMSDSGSDQDVALDRFSLKNKAKKKESDEIRRRELEARRIAMAQKIAVDLEKKATMERLTKGPPEATGMTFLTQKPDLL